VVRASSKSFNTRVYFLYSGRNLWGKKLVLLQKATMVYLIEPVVLTRYRPATIDFSVATYAFHAGPMALRLRYATVEVTWYECIRWLCGHLCYEIFPKWFENRCRGWFCWIFFHHNAISWVIVLFSLTTMACPFLFCCNMIVRPGTGGWSLDDIISPGSNWLWPSRPELCWSML
jgi:hypothetical protein